MVIKGGRRHRVNKQEHKPNKRRWSDAINRGVANRKASLLAHEAQGDSRVEEIQSEGNRSRCGAILCGLGIHEGKWEYVTERECGQARVCRRCGNAKERIKHRFEWRLMPPGKGLWALCCLKRQ